MTFVGTVLCLCGNDGPAIDYRIAQATKVFHKWRKVLQCKHAALLRRVRLATTTFFAAALWLSETWHPTKRQRRRLESWGARMVARAAFVRRKTHEDFNDFWRSRRRCRLHGFAGHLARTNIRTAKEALRTRCLAWWRYSQEQGAKRHPARFEAWRWEEQLTSFYGDAVSHDAYSYVGWILEAQDRGMWKRLESNFAAMQHG